MGLLAFSDCIEKCVSILEKIRLERKVSLTIFAVYGVNPTKTGEMWSFKVVDVEKVRARDFPWAPAIDDVSCVPYTIVAEKFGGGRAPATCGLEKT